MAVLWQFATVHLQDDISTESIRLDMSRLEMALKGITDAYAFQLEAGEETGARHIQIALKLKKKQRVSWMREWSGFPRTLYKAGHWEKIRNIQDAKRYCTKEEGRLLGPYVWGDWPEEGDGRGRRSDLEEVGQRVLDGDSNLAIASDAPGTFIRFHRGINALRGLIRSPLSIERDTFLCVGPAGCGKSHYVRFLDELGARGSSDTFWSVPCGRDIWFDGYAGDSICLFDDFDGRRSSATLADLLRWTDIYPCDVPIKGGFVRWMARYVWFTSNTHPGLWYDWTGRELQWAALKRRFTAIFRWNSADHGDFSRMDRGTADYDAYWGPDPSVHGGMVETPTVIRPIRRLTAILEEDD